MTKRNQIAAANPGGHLLFVEQLRECLGTRQMIGEAPSSSDAIKTPIDVVLVGHDLDGDLKKNGISTIGDHLHYSGCIDTHVVIEDTRGPLPLGLATLMEHYGFAKLTMSKPKFGKGKFVFIGQHNAGNDAVATLKVVVAQALDPELETHSTLLDKCKLVSTEIELADDWYEKPVPGLNPDLVLLVYDTESVTSGGYNPQVKDRTSEHGIAYLRISDVVKVPPGKPFGINWHRYFDAKHWINCDFKNYANKNSVVGNPHGFWPEFGVSQYYYPSEIPDLFRSLFKEITRGSSATEAVRLLEDLSIGATLEPNDFPLLSTALPGVKACGRGPVLYNKNNVDREEFGGGNALISAAKSSKENLWSKGSPSSNHHAWKKGPNIMIRELKTEGAPDHVDSLAIVGDNPSSKRPIMSWAQMARGN